MRMTFVALLVAPLLLAACVEKKEVIEKTPENTGTTVVNPPADSTTTVKPNGDTQVTPSDSRTHDGD